MPREGLRSDLDAAFTLWEAGLITEAYTKFTDVSEEDPENIVALIGLRSLLRQEPRLLPGPSMISPDFQLMKRCEQAPDRRVQEALTYLQRKEVG